jgi:hypothetical protein
MIKTLQTNDGIDEQEFGYEGGGRNKPERIN